MKKIKHDTNFNLYLLACLTVFGVATSPGFGSPLQQTSEPAQSSLETILDTQISRRASEDGFTGALIATLAKEGKINLDAQIGEYLTAVPDEKREITIRHLLTHSFGLDQQYAAEGINDRKAAIADY